MKCGWQASCCLRYYEIRQVFMVSICTVNTQGQISIGVFSIVKKKKTESGETTPPSGLGCQNPTEDDGELHPETLGTSNRGKALINIKANQILKHESLEPMAVY